MLLPRLLTAVVGIPLLLFLIHWGGLAYAAFVVAISVLALYEYSIIVTLGRKPIHAWLTVLGGGVLAAASALGVPAVPVLAGIFILIVLREMSLPAPSLERLSLSVFGIVFLGLLPSYLALIRDLRPDGESLSYFFFLSVWAMDTAAYAAGKLFGRRRLSPRLSPKKTWEGSLAGFAAAMLAAWLYCRWGPAGISRWHILGLGLIIGVLGQASDLAESLVKRAVGAKDSGFLLPGHGGIMDRFDSFLLSAPIFYYSLYFLFK